MCHNTICSMSTLLVFDTCNQIRLRYLNPSCAFWTKCSFLTEMSTRRKKEKKTCVCVYVHGFVCFVQHSWDYFTHVHSVYYTHENIDSRESRCLCAFTAKHHHWWHRWKNSIVVTPLSLSLSHFYCEWLPVWVSGRASRWVSEWCVWMVK